MIASIVQSVDLEDPQIKSLLISPATLERQPTHIREIISSINERRWLIPNFQRYYDWTPRDVKDLLTSIMMEYYVGSLLLWKPRADERLSCAPVLGVADGEAAPAHLVILDGQQRITSLNYAIHPRPDDRVFPGYYYVDLGAFLRKEDDLIIQSDREIPHEETLSRYLFPFSSLSDAGIFSWIDSFKDQFSSRTADERVRVSEICDIIRQKMFRVLGQFEIPRVELPEAVEFDSVAAVFENLNSKGKPLGTFDLLIVRLSTYDVQLKDLWDATLAEHRRIREYYEERPKMAKLGLYIMESISLAHTTRRSCKRKDILNLFTDNRETVDGFTEKWRVMSRYIERAIEYLEDTLGATGKRNLPYEPVIPILAALLYKIDRDFGGRQDCMEKTHYWYWTSVFASRFSSAVDSKKSADFGDMLKWFEDDFEIPTDVRNFRESYHTQVRLRDVRRRGSVYLGVFSLLAVNGARDLQRRLIMDEQDLHMDHVFPRSRFGRGGLEDSVLNMTWLTRETNTRDKRDMPPSRYLPYVLEKAYRGDDAGLAGALECHLMDDACRTSLESDDFAGFVMERERILLDRIGEAIGANPDA